MVLSYHLEEVGVVVAFSAFDVAVLLHHIVGQGVGVALARVRLEVVEVADVCVGEWVVGLSWCHCHWVGGLVWSETTAHSTC